MPFTRVDVEALAAAAVKFLDKHKIYDISFVQLFTNTNGTRVESEYDHVIIQEIGDETSENQERVDDERGVISEIGRDVPSLTLSHDGILRMLKWDMIEYNSPVHSQELRHSFLIQLLVRLFA